MFLGSFCSGYKKKKSLNISDIQKGLRDNMIHIHAPTSQFKNKALPGSQGSRYHSPLKLLPPKRNHYPESSVCHSMHFHMFFTISILCSVSNNIQYFLFLTFYKCIINLFYFYFLIIFQLMHVASNFFPL